MGDRFVVALLRSPAHRLLSGSVMLLSYPAGGGGDRTIPVMYARAGGDLVVAAAHPACKRWWRSLRTPTHVRVRVRGTELEASAVTLTDAGDIEQATAAYLQRFPRSSSALGVETEGDSGLAGDSIKEAGSAVMVRVTPAQTGSTSVGHRSTWTALVGFYALTLAISWGWMLPLVLAGSVVHRGSDWPTHLPALMGPMIAAAVVTAWMRGTPGLRDLGERMIRWRVGARWWFWGLGSPLAYFAAGVGIVRLSEGHWPNLAGLDRYSGVPAIGVVGVWLVAILGALGEESGWRGFALPQLQRRYSPLIASLIIAPMWAFWHAPLFAVLSTYRDFGPMQYPGFVFGLACGSVVLTWLYNRSGASVLIVAVWHGTFNLFGGATAATQGTIAAVVSTAIMFQAMLLIALDLRARHRGSPSILGPPASIGLSTSRSRGSSPGGRSSCTQPGTSCRLCERSISPGRSCSGRLAKRRRGS